MSVLTRNRAVLFLLLIAAPLLRADYPSGRIEPRMVYDPVSFTSILFGGQTPLDRATGKVYELNETWSWDGARWIQKYPVTVPPGRASHVMVWDSNHNHAIMYGGEREAVQLDDTWIYRNNNWQQVETATSPGTRKLAGAAYDSVRNRVVLYGGGRISADGRSLNPLHDTWEFDGGTWTQVGSNGPQIAKPILAYDVARNRTVMIGFNESDVVSFWAWQPSSRTWIQLFPTALPPCVNEAGMVWQSHNETVALIGGVCNDSGAADEVWEWDDEAWKKVTSTQQVTRLFGHAMSYDARRQAVVTVGGTTAVGALNSTTHSFVNRDWVFHFDGSTPGPRSLFALRADPANDVVWLYGGVTDAGGTASDFWQYKHGDWTQLAVADTPDNCVNPLSALDTDRAKLVIFCGNASIFEFDGAAMKWQAFSPGTVPDARRFANMVYDAQLKKTVLYGGFDEVNYLNDTWTWDGAKWTEITKNRLPARSLHMMWFDPTLRKTVAYGGLGRPSSEDRIVRYADMYTFDGTGWTKLDITTPGARYGGQVTVNPSTGKAVLFGGIFFEAGAGTDPGKQTFVDDIWEFSGSSWTRQSFARVPPARENGGLEWDPSTHQLIVFGGYAGQFYSDIWGLDAAHATWSPRTETIIRRRAGPPTSPPTP
jgi:N-acetylneuraminic acid mutarotase